LQGLDIESERAQDEALVGQILIDGLYVRITNEHIALLDKDRKIIQLFND